MALFAPFSAHAGEQFQRVVPPKLVIPQLERVGLASPNDRQSVQFRDAVASALRGKLMLARGVSAIDEGLRTDVLASEQFFAPSTLSARDVGALAATKHVGAVMVLEADGKGVSSDHYSEERNQFVKKADGTYGNKTWTVQCTRNTVHVTMSYTYYASDGGVVDLDERIYEASDADCREREGDTRSVRSYNELIDGLIAGRAPSYAAMISPHWEAFSVELIDEKAVHDAYGAALKRSWLGVSVAATATLQDFPYNAAAVYYLGLAMEFQGKPGPAASLFAFANRMDEQRVFVEARQRAMWRVSELAVLNSGFALEPRPVSTPGLEPVLERAARAVDTPVRGRPATITGSKKKPVPLFSDADPSSSLVCDSATGVSVVLFGGSTIRRIGVKDDMVQVQLPDGVEGWVLRRYVR